MRENAYIKLTLTCFERDNRLDRHLGRFFVFDLPQTVVPDQACEIIIPELIYAICPL